MFLVLKREGVGIYLFHGGGIPRCSSYRIFLAIVFEGDAAVDRSTVPSFPRGRQLDAAVGCLIHYRETLDWVCVGRGALRFGNVALPGSDRAIRPEYAHGRDR